MARFLATSILLPLLIPPVIFSLCALAKGMPAAETLAAVVEQYSARRTNLLLCGLAGLFPIVLLFAVMWLHSRFGGSRETRNVMAWTGLLSVVLVLVWVNLQFWPIFLPHRVYPGFPHGLEFIIGPGLFAPVALLIGMGLGWWFGRKAA